MEALGRDLKKICFFDSGIGGLTLLRASAKRIKGAKFYYFADNFNVPYGNFTQGRLEKSVNEIFTEIAKIKPDASVVACNTVTARCIGYLRHKFSFPIVGIQPAVKEAVARCGGCTVLATAATANSESLKNLINKFGCGSAEVIACPQLATFVEDNIFNLEKSEEVFKLLPAAVSSSVVLGCTHYIYIKDLITKKYGLPVFTGVDGTVNRIIEVTGAQLFEGENFFNDNVQFVGGDEKKNEKVFFDVLSA